MSHNNKQSNRGEEVSKLRLPDAADPRDGVSLIRTFLEIKEPAWREKLIHLAEDLASFIRLPWNRRGRGEPQTRVPWFRRSCEPPMRMRPLCRRRCRRRLADRLL